jgi:hypothetical protein
MATFTRDAMLVTKGVARRSLFTVWRYGRNIWSQYHWHLAFKGPPVDVSVD